MAAGPLALSFFFINIKKADGFAACEKRYPRACIMGERKIKKYHKK
jgi:hypothetical protein